MNQIIESIEYLSKKKILQITFMKYIDEEENSEENFVNHWVFKYLLENKVKLTPSLCFYSIHSANLEFFHILEENQIEPQESVYWIFISDSMS